MQITANILDILVCPKSKQSLALAPEALIQQLNQKILQRQIFTTANELVVEEISAGLVRADGLVIYPIREEIPVLLIEEGILI
jgi:uncharacterized protein YbaR (Trm112 family)